MTNISNKRILVVTPNFPWPPRGACEKDRTQGIKDFVDYGFGVRVITRNFKHHDLSQIDKVYNDLGVKIYPVSYKYTNQSKVKKILMYLRRFLNPFYLDGSVFESRDKELQETFEKQLKEFNPDIVWFDYTFFWPLYKIVRKYNKKIITRSDIFDPLNLLEEDGYTLLNYIRFIPKLLTEYLAVKKSDWFFSITPKESKIYRRLGAKKISNLPLRALTSYLDKRANVVEKDVLDVFFMGSTYNVVHNRRALEYIIKEVAPEIHKTLPGKFKFHILGNKFPDDLRVYLKDNVTYEGYVEDLDKFLDGMDIALAPSAYGAGMQQKIFEPITRGFPTVSQKRGLADYDFVDGEDILLFESIDDLKNVFQKLLNLDYRKKISTNARNKASKLFSQEAIAQLVKDRIDKLLQK
jgi:hypothetical protein